ncbi:hypothetical protein [Bifidobacterium miconisargentati]|uniref:hypothetical protein n=1 Tax=Bifidobacterium miconisargentati TaxID=2834437 RepID=UPI001BDC6D11|nr:hypothetical protein [Bifidobacterium miconisargentati]MBW3090401.1 hypothetical protein [Bifidobacterium miconisargentati]
MNRPEPPTLQLEHSPGFTLREYRDPGNECSLVVFETELDEFGLSFAIDLFEDGQTSNVIETNGPIGEDLTAEQLNTFGDRCDLLQEWFDDCATAQA